MAEQRILPGTVWELSQTVTEERTARHIGSGSERVFATPAMVGLIERACVELMAPHLPPGRSSVGIAINVRHLAATPLGKTVRARVEVTAVEGATVSFTAEVFDEVEKVGEGEHKRAIVDVERFLRRVRAKTGG
ncbi:MAG TPA: thioesterase family protein [Anaerolineales bacterium]|nr:thioesterase family protein [Anaerolineales bacterium]